MTRTRTRKMLHSTVGAVAVFAAISTGAGISAAATTGSAAPDLPGTTQTSTYQWSLTNRTGTPIFGRWSVSETQTQNRSSVESTKDRPWYPDATQSTTQDYTGKNLTWQARICYRGRLWGPNPSTPPPTMDTKSPTSFNLTVTPDYRLVVSYSGNNYELGTDRSDPPC
ncbi:hypothetical protein R3Q06_29335 [Rhodococcus erythropolis]|uniref:hypothetical protein n=1 Tax=Rhodococcus erythropolis TaxID=1833 RepID=UPI002949FEB9|nr:hypothetical protein [Rhodococcus erythropolis]MDV6277599.1 hypothetical protein [Rhodococcus erythropolis]